MSRPVLILDDDEDLRATLSDMLRLRCGVPSLLVPDVASMIELGDTALAACLAIIDVNLGAGKPSGIDAYHWLTMREFGGRIVFLTGHARAHGIVQEALRERAAEVLQKPASVTLLCRLVEESRA